MLFMMVINQAEEMSLSFQVTEVPAINDGDKSPVTKRRLTEDSNIEFYDQTSDHSNDDRLVYNAPIRRNTI
ncbi:unnamed protein product, partial [Rotaria magnacalcarata]